jgi:23S rRNA (adenine2503-C2)-methyltransferase
MRGAPPNTDLLELTSDELHAVCLEVGERPYRARQLLEWIYRKGERDLAQMSNLPAAFRTALGGAARIGSGTVEEVSRSSDGKTAKYLFRLEDGERVEAVSMREGGHHTVCLSSQVGCAMGCRFCATGDIGFRRDLRATEILLQFMDILKGEGHITNVVFMGMGEPLLNVDNVLKAVEALTDPLRFGLGTRKVTVSTCGIVPGIKRLAESKSPVRLALSLNSPFQEQRVQLMPIARKYPLGEVLRACEEFAQIAGKRVMIEYVLLGGVNTDRQSARELVRIAQRLDNKVNLIEYNPKAPSTFQPPDKDETGRFRQWLEREGVAVTVRFRRGREIAAGCGQLAGKKHAT